MLRLQTERLELVACPGQVARAVYSSRRRAEALLGFRVHEEWPGMEIRAYLPMYAQQVDVSPELLGWGIWLIVHSGERTVIGDVGFKGRPDRSGTVDIGYGVVEPYRRQGYAFEAAAALRDWAFTHSVVKRLTGDCMPTNVASARILEKLGMRWIGISDAGLLLWEMFST